MDDIVAGIIFIKNKISSITRASLFVSGEKYMGMWMGDAKHGSAVLVTLDGLYIEGCFNNNKMTVCCSPLKI